MPSSEGPDDPLAVVTVGSTQFAPLITHFLSSPIFASLAKLGMRRVLVQYGTMSTPPVRGEAWEAEARRVGLEVEVVKFVDDMEDLLANCSLAITHAGAGSILGVLRSKRTPPPMLIVVPNPTLMDSHQTDLAEAIASNHWGLSTTAEQLEETVRRLADDPALRSSCMQRPKPSTGMFRDMIDQEMGYA